MSQKISHSKDYYNLLDTIIENELIAPLRSNEMLWVQMGTQLEIEGLSKHKISTVMRKDIEDQLYEKQFKDHMLREEYRWHNNSYWLVTKKNGWTNPDMARHVSDPIQDQDNSSINTPNGDMIELFYELMSICKIAIEKTKEATPLEEIFGTKEMREFYRQRSTMIKNCKYALDDKTKIPANTELILLECMATVIGNISHCAKKFMEIRIFNMGEQGKFLTVKQASKYQRGNKQSHLNLLKPLSRDTALDADYWGIQCVCGSWRIREKVDSGKLECYDCELEFDKTYVSKCKHCQIPLFKERLQYIVKNGKCENCNSQQVLPPELLLIANS